MAFILVSQNWIGCESQPRAASHGRVVGGADVDFFKVLVVECAADLLDDRHAAARLEVGWHGVAEGECQPDLAAEGARLLHEAGKFDLHLLLIERETDDFAPLVHDRLLLVRVVEG